MTKRRYDSAASRRDLIAAARHLFAANGYAATNAAAVVELVGLSRGALYHHFDGKEGLFRVVLEEMQAEIAAAIAERAAAARCGLVERLRIGFGVYLDMAMQSDIRQVLLIDGPAVLGWSLWHEIDMLYGYEATQGALARAMAEGEIALCPVAELTQMLLAAVTQAGLEIGRAADPAAARKAYGEVIDMLLDRLQQPPGV
jgi:AcrR family transcriptional regulator